MPWSRRFDIPENRDLTMQEMSDGSLRIIPGDIHEEEKESKIPILKEDTEDRIYYKILREYLEGAKKITLVGNLNDEQMDFIQVIHRRIVGLEVTEQTENEIVLTDLLKPEDVDLDKIVNQMFSFNIAMTKDILTHIQDGKSPGDKILDRDSVTTRNHNLAYRCCFSALKDSIYLSKLGKITKDILIYSRIIRYLDMIGTTLVGISYLINTEMTEGMRKYHYRVFDKDGKLNEALTDYLEEWLDYFRSVKKVLKNGNLDQATELYIQRFDLRFDSDGLEKGEHLTNVVNFTDQLNRMSSLIVRDFMMSPIYSENN